MIIFSTKVITDKKGALLFTVAEKYIKDPEYTEGISIDCSATKINSDFENEAYQQMEELIMLAEIKEFIKESSISKTNINNKDYYICNVFKENNYKTYLFTESNGFIIKFIFNYKNSHNQVSMA